MKVLVAGATGAIGRPLVARLLELGHEVWAMSRSGDPVGPGAHGIAADALDLDAVRAAVAGAQPDVIVQQLTSLPRKVTPKAMAEGYAATDRVRVQGTRNLVTAAAEHGSPRVIAQSIAFAYRPEGGWVKSEDAPLHADAPQPMGTVIARLEAMEREVISSGGVALRYGFFYGPGTWYHPTGAIGQMVAKRFYPIIGAGTGTSSWLHIDDAVDATVAALEGGEPGAYNVVDDHPAPASEWIPAMAQAFGAKAPRRVPVWLARRVGGPLAVHYAIDVRGADNTRFKETFGWRPHHPHWREGFLSLRG